MTLPLAAEAVGGLAGAGGAGAAAAGTEAGAGGAAVRSTAARRSVTARTGVQPTSPKPPATKPPASGRTGKGSASSSASSKRTSRSRALSIPKFSGLKGGSGAAHKVVIAEFVLCVVLIGIAPILVRPPAPDGSGREHVYLANDFVRLTATCLLFFVLALLANQPRSARFAAAFGGLVVLGAAFNANKAFIAVSSLFTTPKTATP